jgi:hypothetical protein
MGIEFSKKIMEKRRVNWFEKDFEQIIFRYQCSCLYIYITVLLCCFHEICFSIIDHLTIYEYKKNWGYWQINKIWEQISTNNYRAVEQPYNHKVGKMSGEYSSGFV